MSVQKTQHNTTDEQAITATSAAIAHFKNHLAKHGGSGVRINIVKAGCSGYRYEVTFIDEVHPITENEKTFMLDDNLLLSVPKKIFPSVMGTKIDYIKKGLGGELVYDNPQQTGACGCGESFMVD